MDMAQLHITVGDLDRSIAFYRDVVGLDFLFAVPDQDMAFLQAGPVRIYLGAAEGTGGGSHPMAYYRVSDVAAEHARMVAAGAPSDTGPHRVHTDVDHELWMASVRDPDGHHVILMEERAIG